MRGSKRFLCVPVCGAAFTFLVSMGVEQAVAACTTGGQCEISDGSTESRNGDNFIAAGAGVDSSSDIKLVNITGAIVLGNGSTLQGTNLNISAAGAYEYGALVGKDSTLDLTNSTITGDYGIYVGDVRSYPNHIASSPNSALIMQGGAIATDNRALLLKGNSFGGVSADLTNVDITVSGNHVAVQVDSNGHNNFSMDGGSITGMTLGAFLATGSHQTVNLTNVTINSGGSYGVMVGGGGTGNILNIIGGAITHNGGNGAVSFFGGDALIDGTIVKNTGGGGGVLLGSSSSTSYLKAQNGFEFESFGVSAMGLNIDNTGKADISDGKITTHGKDAFGIRVSPSSHAIPLVAKRVQIETFGDNAHGIYLMNGSSTLMDIDIKIHGMAFGLASHGNTAKVVMTGGTIDADGVNAIAAFAHDGGNLEFDGVDIQSLNNSTGGKGVQVQVGSSATLKNNTNVLTDGASAAGLFFLDTTGSNSINVDQSTVTAQDSVAAWAAGGTNTLNVTDGSILQGDRLVHASNSAAGGNIYGANLDINVDNSHLYGISSLTSISTLTMNLNNDALWVIRPSNAGVVRSDVSFVTLDDSTIVFDQNGTGLFQELWVGSGNLGGATTVWTGVGDAILRLNSYLNDGGALTNQFTDRLLIEGDVSGQTYVQINQIAGSPGGWTSPSGSYANNEGISIIQVSGNAAEDSFVLDGGYVTIGGQPYAYDIFAYGPGSSNGAADSAQKQVSGTNHWDFRLQSLISSMTGLGRSAIVAVVPQLANYLVAPNALFHAGLQDVGTLHQRLGELRQHADNQGRESQAGESRSEFFLRGYGGDYAYRSSLTPSQYGYNADIHYTALQAGGNLYGFETANSLLRFGIAGSYGDLAFTPHRTDSQKTKMDVWSVSPYMTWQHDSGAYLDVILSYGGFDGFVTTAARGRTARLQGHSFAASVEAGMPFALGDKGWSIEPQAQLIYQKLKFDATDDIDNFVVELGAPEQMTLRVGGELAKHFTTGDEGATDVKLYGKLNLVHGFGNDNKAWFGDDFGIGRSGTHVEAGVGAQVTVGNKLNLYGEANWQERVSSGGTSGISFNAGLNFRF